jgi:uncharacterized protein (DUF1778 family)
MIVDPKKRVRIALRLAGADAALIRAGAERLDCSVSELMRRAAIDAALRALGRGSDDGQRG